MTTFALFLAFAAPNAMAGDVYWDVEPSEIILDFEYGNAIDFGFTYNVEVEEDETGPLLLRTCEFPSQSRSSCYTIPLQNPAQTGVGYVRYGIDASQYDEGENEYTLSLFLGGWRNRVVDTLTIMVNVENDYTPL